MSILARNATLGLSGLVIVNLGWGGQNAAVARLDEVQRSTHSSDSFSPALATACSGYQCQSLPGGKGQLATDSLMGAESSLPFSADLNSAAFSQGASNYILGPGDRIEVRVLGYETFDWALIDRVIPSDGTIRFPFIGTVVVAGKTLDMLGTELNGRLRDYLTAPQVDISLTALRPVIVNVTGEVYRPGPVQLGSLTQSQTNINQAGAVTTSTTTPNLSSALTAAGGIQRNANIRDIKIIRRVPGGQSQTLSVNLWDALQGNSDIGVIVMFDGDTVFVPEATALDGLEPSLVARSSLAPANVRVRVIGEVTNPGEVLVQPNSSASAAIAAAGGQNTLTAQMDSVRLVRLSRTGQLEEQTLDLTSLVDTQQIQDGDVIFVPKRGYLSTVDGISRVLTPLFAPLNILNLFNLFN